MAADNVMVPAEDLVNYDDAQSTSRNTTQMSDRSTGTSNARIVNAFRQVQKLGSENPGQALGPQEDYCPCDGGFAIR